MNYFGIFFLFFFLPACFTCLAMVTHWAEKERKYMKCQEKAACEFDAVVKL